MGDFIKCNYCDEKIFHYEIWLLSDIKNFTNRKLSFGVCPKCHSPILVLNETRNCDGKIFIDANIHGRHAVRTLHREKKRLVSKLYKLSPDNLSGFIYGVNKEIKYKKSTKIRQYSCDLKTNNKVKCKEITLRK